MKIIAYATVSDKGFSSIANERIPGLIGQIDEKRLCFKGKSPEILLEMRDFSRFFVQPAKFAH